MIIFNDRVLYVHNPKTAGTSMLRYLGEVLPPPVYIAGVKELGTNHPSLAASLRHARAITGKRPGQVRRIICTIRNPFEREESMYCYFRAQCKSPTLRADLNDPRMEHLVRMTERLNFPDYLLWLWRQFGSCDIWRSRSYYYTADGEMPRNLFIVRTEHIEADIANALAGIPLQRPGVAFPRLNVSDRQDHWLFWTDRAKDIVAHSYQWMFDGGFLEPARTA